MPNVRRLSSDAGSRAELRKELSKSMLFDCDGDQLVGVGNLDIGTVGVL
jgi:hypothetical protein